MKSKLSIISAMATIVACNGLAVYSVYSTWRFAPATELANKQQEIGLQSAGNCFYNSNKPIVCPWIMK